MIFHRPVCILLTLTACVWSALPLCAQNRGDKDTPPKAAEQPSHTVDYQFVEKVVAMDQGRLLAVRVRPGHLVKKGDLLGQLDYRRQWFNLERAKVQAKDHSKIRELEAEVSMNSSILEEHRERLRKRQVNEHVLMQSEARLQASRAKLDAARTAQALQALALQEAQISYDDRFFFSPIDGVVVAVLKEEHENVAPGNVVFIIGDNSSWVVRQQVSAEVAADLFIGKSLQLLRVGSGAPRFGQITGLLPTEDGQYIVETKVPNSAPAAQTTPPQFEEPKLTPP